MHYKVLQINGSNADFGTKLTELQTTINSNKSEIVIISEANSEVDDPEQMEARRKAFPSFSFEDKTVTGNPKARCTVMVGNHIKYKRLIKYEDPLNSSIALRVKDGCNRWIAILGI